MKPLRILFILLGDRNTASSRVRGFWMAEELEKHGMLCRVIPIRGRKTLLRCLVELPRHDIVYFQKQYSKWYLRLMMIARHLGKKTIFDMDDAPSRINDPVKLGIARKVLSQSSVVVVGSQSLLEYAKKYQPNSYLLPTSVKLEHYMPGEKTDSGEPICLGWIGNGAHYNKDLAAILSKPLKTIGSCQQVRFKIVGARGNPLLYETFSNIPGVQTTFVDQIPWSNPAAIRDQLAEFDIGLYPVLNSEYNRYKCGFKALEYMAMQIPVVASPVGILGTMIQHGEDGYLASTANEWSEALWRLVTNGELRQMMGKNGRKKVEESYDVQKTAKYFAALIKGMFER